MSIEIDRERKIGVSVIDAQQIESLFAVADASPRKRAILTLDRTPSETVQKTVLAIFPESYLRPNKLTHPSQIATFSPLSGVAELLTFSDEGRVIKKVPLTHGKVVEVEADTWYTLVARSRFAMLELKSLPPGLGRGKEIYAPWAPEEGTREGQEYLESLKRELGATGS
ncbi:MAG: WbuC family cupin fold metalloprotein [Patescibacteria group bacterium]